MISNENVVKYKVSQLFEIYICCFRVLGGMIHRTTPASSAQSSNPARPQLSRSRYYRKTFFIDSTCVYYFINHQPHTQRIKRACLL